MSISDYAAAFNAIHIVVFANFAPSLNEEAWIRKGDRLVPNDEFQPSPEVRLAALKLLAGLTERVRQALDDDERERSSESEAWMRSQQDPFAHFGWWHRICNVAQFYTAMNATGEKLIAGDGAHAFLMRVAQEQWGPAARAAAGEE